MNTHALRLRPKPYNWGTAILVSVLIHVILAVVWILLTVFELLIFKAQEVVQRVEEPPQYIEISPEFFEPVVPEPPTPQSDEKRYLPSTAAQQSEQAPEETRYFGERNTLAASEEEAVDSDLEIPSQQGEEPRFENELELTNSSFADGEQEGIPNTPGNFGQQGNQSSPLLATESNPTQEQEEVPSEAQEEVEVEEELPEPNSQELAQQEQVKVSELLSLDESIEVPLRETIPEPQEEVAEEEKIPEPQKKKKEVAQGGGAAPGQRGAQSGFQREARKTRLRGSIRRRGKSAVDIEDSIKGRYVAQVNRAIERLWQRECIQRRQHILPGVLTVNFTLNEKGDVLRFAFVDRIAGGVIQEGFTMRAVRKANLPPMPKELKSELEGEPLDMLLTFFF